MILRLVRVSENKGATKGALCFNNEPEMLTLELPYRDNHQEISCIPDGKYTVRRYFSDRFKRWCYAVMNVPKRQGILFHPGNLSGETAGCILVGQRYGHLNGYPAILNSEKAFQQFMFLMNGIEEADLIIVSAFGAGVAH